MDVEKPKVLQCIICKIEQDDVFDVSDNPLYKKVLSNTISLMGSFL
jgi:hypothetical protein